MEINNYKMIQCLCEHIKITLIMITYVLWLFWHIWSNTILSQASLWVGVSLTKLYNFFFIFTFKIK